MLYTLDKDRFPTFESGHRELWRLHDIVSNPPEGGSVGEKVAYTTELAPLFFRASFDGEELPLNFDSNRNRVILTSDSES